MITYIIRDTVFPKVKSTLSDTNKTKEFMKIVTSYIDRNMDKLSMIGPIKRVLFTDIERDKIYTLIGINASTIETAVDSTSYIKSGTIPGKPFFILMAMIIRYYKIQKMIKEMNMAIVYLTLAMYPSLHSKYFKFEPNEQIMAATINNMSNKFKLKKTGTILQALTETTMMSDKHYHKDLLEGNDKNIADYILSFQTRLNGLLKNIMAEFMKEHKQKHYMNYEIDSDDEDNYHVADSNSYLITRITDAVVLQLSVQGPNSMIVSAAAKVGDCSISDLRNTCHDICTNRDERDAMKKMVSTILYLFLFDGNHSAGDITSSKFFLFCNDVYRKANTSNENIIIIKRQLDTWLSKYSELYRKSHRVATINQYRRALYLFFVFTIQRTKIS